MQIDPGQKLRKAFDEAEKALKASQAVSAEEKHAALMIYHTTTKAALIEYDAARKNINKS